VKVASRCNLDCDYCYVYHHADQSWRGMPPLMSAENRSQFAERLGSYVKEIGLTRCAVIFHGGEPLLAGAEVLTAFAAEIRAGTTAKVDISLQTNGLLLDDAALDAFEAADIGVSLSIDGPRLANDRHRTSRRGRSSFDKAFTALQRLIRRPKTFAGVISVIDPAIPPTELLAFFDEHRPPKLDFLLPDAHHLRAPAGRDQDQALYERWMIQAFDLWLDRYPHLPVRTFEALLDSVSGLPSGTDAFGLGDVSLISIETDGSYHDLDVLKVTREGATRLTGTVSDTPIAAVAMSPPILAHRALLQTTGLCETCQACPVVAICGGGSLPHRYGPEGFNHPTIYCREMLALIEHVQERLAALIPTPNVEASSLLRTTDLSHFDLAEHATNLMDVLCGDAEHAAREAFDWALRAIKPTNGAGALALAQIEQLSDAARSDLASRPGAVAWRQAFEAQAAGRAVYAVDGTAIRADAGYLLELLAQPSADSFGFRTGDADRWLRAPFGNAIQFEGGTTAERARPLVREALAIIGRWRPALLTEMRQACRAIQFVRDPLAQADKIVSFSDNSVPGALYVSVMQGDGLIDAYDLADSLVHEHRHQKLYLLERQAPTVEPTAMLVRSPWREDLRPPSGLLHAVFVFVELRRFWTFVRDSGPSRLHNRAVNQLQDTEQNLLRAFETLETCPLTEVGRQLVSILKAAEAGELTACPSV
jgi:uncharacterized protein